MLTNKMKLPQPFVDAAASKRKVVQDQYSCTTILKGVCEIILSRRHADEITEDVSDRVWAIFGTAVHKILEQGKETAEQIKEGSVKVPVGKYTLTGIFDLYDDATGTVTDYKTAATIKYQKGEFEDYRQQTLIYCWMLRQYGFDAHRAEIVMILRDWVKSKAKFDAEYPQTQVQKVSFEFTDEDFKQIETFINAKFDAIDEAQALPDGELVPCDESERWHRPDTWAVVKDGNKKAYRVLSSEHEAQEMAESLSSGDKRYHIEHRPGEDAKCEGYCAVKQWCPLWAENC